MDLPAQPLPRPPDVVVRPLETFGSVTFDHRKHLAARASCVRCHGPGRVGKVELGARVAHARCITCHTEVSRGPTQCAGCHDRGATRKGTAVAPASAPPGPAPEPRAKEPGHGAAAGAPAEVSSAGAGPTAPTPGEPPAAPAGPTPSTPIPGSAADLHAPPPVEPSLPHHPDRQLVQLGFDAGQGVGGSLRIASRGERFEAAYSISRLSDGERARVLLLFDFGVARPLGAGLSWWAVGTAGFDAQELPSLGFGPAIGARLGIEWALPRGWIVRSLHLSATGLLTAPPAWSFGEPTGGGRFFFTLATGLPIPGLPADAAP